MKRRHLISTLCLSGALSISACTEDQTADIEDIVLVEDTVLQNATERYSFELLESDHPELTVELEENSIADVALFSRVDDAYLIDTTVTEAGARTFEPDIDTQGFYDLEISADGGSVRVSLEVSRTR